MPTNKKTETAVVEEEQITVAGKNLVATDPSYDDMEDWQETGLTQDDMAVPRLIVLQKGSRQVDETHAQYQPIEGAKAGTLYNSVTDEIWDGKTGIWVVPVAYRQSFIEWRPRDDGGGIVADHSEEQGIMETWAQIVPNEKGARVLPNGNHLVRSADHYILIVDGDTGTAQEAVLTLSGSQLKKSRKWNTMMAGRTLKRSNGTLFRPRPYAFVYNVKTKPESNKKGSWFGVDFTPQAEVLRLINGGELYNQAKGFEVLIIEGKKRAAEAQPHDEEKDDDIPF